MQRRTNGSSATTTKTGDSNGNHGGVSTLPMKRVRRKKKKSLYSSSALIEFNEINTLLFIIFVLTLIIVGLLFVFFTSPSGEGQADARRNRQRTNPKFMDHFDAASYKGERRGDEMHDIGDKSMKYRKLREEFDVIVPLTEDASVLEARKELAAKLRKRSYKSIMGEVECPLYPPEGYPKAWNILDIISNWNPDDTTPHEAIYQGICVFDFDTEYDKAINYRNAEVPYVVRNDPQVLRTVERWNLPDYLPRLLPANEPHRAEYSTNNHFMYWMQKGIRRKKKNKPGNNPPKGWKAPTEMIRMSYPDWLQKASVGDEELLAPDSPHWYFRLIGCGKDKGCDKGSSEFLFDELPFFQPKKNLYMVKPESQRGIHCRFGMKGVIAENHFDGSRNNIALLGGERRYILGHPNQCTNMALLPKSHPSGRHSAVDWSDPDLETYPQFKNVKANEIVLQAGDVLYLPTQWFHYIISLETNYQCNTRSGISSDYASFIHECGF